MPIPAEVAVKMVRFIPLKRAAAIARRHGVSLRMRNRLRDLAVSRIEDPDAERGSRLRQAGDNKEKEDADRRF